MCHSLLKRSLLPKWKQFREQSELWRSFECDENRWRGVSLSSAALLS